MTAPMFKEGERVEFVMDYGTRARVGDRGVVMGIASDGIVSVDLDRGGAWVYALSHRMKPVLEPAPDPDPVASSPEDDWIEVEVQRRVAGVPHRVEYNDRGDPVRWWVREDPALPLPTDPGYYLAEKPDYGSTVVVELLNRPVGQWVDAGDRNYLDEQQVRALGALQRLEVAAVTAAAVIDRVLNMPSWSDSIPINAIEKLRAELVRPA